MRSAESSTIPSTRPVVVTDTATDPLRPAEASRWTSRSRARSGGISTPCSSISSRRSAARSKTAPRSAPIVRTSRLASSGDASTRTSEAKKPCVVTASTPSGPSTSGNVKDAAE